MLKEKRKILYLARINKLLQFKGVLLLALFLIIPAFAQEAENLTDSNNMMNMTNSSEITISPQTNTSWNVGIFAIIGSAITFIGILLGHEYQLLGIC